MSIERSTLTMNVPATAGQYAPEEIVFAPTATGLQAAPLLGVQAVIVSNAATSAALEVWLLEPGKDPSVAGNWSFYDSMSSGGKLWPMASWPGAKLRAKSGGTAGAMVVAAAAD